MKIKVLLMSATMIVCLGSGAMAKKNPSSCLPDGIKAADVVSTRMVPSRKGRHEIRKTTVERTLKEIKARCSNGKLVDASGTEIRFYRLTGCWGHPSPDDQEVLERQSRELAALKKQYRVIELTCNPSGEQIPRSRP